MQNIAIHKAQELPADARQAVERVLGRPLREEEEVSIMALSSHEAPMGDERQAVARNLEQRIKKTAKRVKDVADDQLEEVINQAVDHVRSHPR
jgi:L-lactate utilization protein LutC